MSLPLVQIDRFLGRNPSGISVLWLVVPEDVEDLPESLAVPSVDRGITLKEGATLYKIGYDPGSAGHREDTRGNNNQGDFYERSVTFDVRRLRVSVSDLRRRLKNRRCHIVFEDSCGQTMLYTWMRLRGGAAEGPGRGYNGNRFQFRGGSDRPAVFIEGEILDAPGQTEDNILILQPSTGNKFKLIVGPCEELITIPVNTTDPTVEVAVDNYIVTIGEDDELNTTLDPGNP